LVVVLVLVAFPLWAIIRIFKLGRENEAIAEKLQELEREVIQLRNARSSTAPAAPTASPAARVASPAPTPAAPATTAPIVPPPAAALPATVTTPTPTIARPLPPPLASTPAAPAVTAAPAQPAAATARPIPATYAQPAPPPAPPKAGLYFELRARWANINWELFMGVKLFAWLGGLAAFLGAAFLLRYSFEHNWIPPEVRVAAGFLFAIGLVVGGLRTARTRYVVTAETLIATGIVSLYAVTFACNSIYHFALFGPLATFAVMTLITATAFLLAVRLNARVVAILGILGGFLTPVLLSTGQDNPAGLFGYTALLDAGLIAVALNRRWHFLVPLGAAGTVLMQLGWAGKFFNDEKDVVAVLACVGLASLFLVANVIAGRRGRSSPTLHWSAVGLACVCFGFALAFTGYPELCRHPGSLFTLVLLADLILFVLAWQNRQAMVVLIAAAGAALVECIWVAQSLAPSQASTAMAIALGFCALFLGAFFTARSFNRRNTPTPSPVAREITWSAAAMPFVCFGLSFAFLLSPAVASRAGLLLGFTLLADVALLVLAWYDELMPRLHLVAGGIVFAILAAWTASALNASLLPWALAFYLAFAVLHTAYPLVLERFRPAASPTWWSQLFPPLALVLLFIPILKLDAVSLALWPCVLLVDVLAVVACFLTGSLAAVATVLLMTLAGTGLWLFRVPAALSPTPVLLLVTGGFAVFFFAAALYLGRRIGTTKAANGIERIFGDTRSQLPAFSALLPFILLIMMTQRLSLTNPSPVFGLALLLTLLTLGLAKIMTLEWLPACALVGTAALEHAWQSRFFGTAPAVTALGWYGLFEAVFVIYPFLFRRQFAAMTGPWAVSALVSVAQFPLVYHLIKATWPNDVLGLIPAAFSLPSLLGLVAVLRLPGTPERPRLNQLAWFGGVALLFITLIFPIQFERQWLTLAWALEGAALLWLFHRVPHPGLRATGAVLLLVAFARLALNPAVLEYHPRSSTPLLNWYLYSYGIVTAALFVGAALAAAPRNRILGLNAPPVFNTLGTVLAFLLVNIEIADFFSVPGTRVLTFEFSGNFGRDMTYTIAWSLFALAMLLISIWRQLRPGRYAALALLGVAVLKLFFHDLARLDSLYRIGALFAVAVVAIVASVAYQRFLPGNDQKKQP
jgi:uncharacterized membrane protein